MCDLHDSDSFPCWSDMSCRRVDRSRGLSHRSLHSSVCFAFIHAALLWPPVKSATCFPTPVDAEISICWCIGPSFHRSSMWHQVCCCPLSSGVACTSGPYVPFFCSLNTWSPGYPSVVLLPSLEGSWWSSIIHLQQPSSPLFFYSSYFLQSAKLPSAVLFRLFFPSCDEWLVSSRNFSIVIFFNATRGRYS